MRRAGNKPFPSFIADFFPDPSSGFSTILDFTIPLKDGNDYIYRYTFPLLILIPPAQGLPSYWADICSKTFFFFPAPARTGGVAFNFSVRPIVPSKMLN